MATPYVDLNTIHNPATGTVPPAAWGDQVRDNFESHEDPPACSCFRNTSQAVPSGSTLGALNANDENYDNDSMHSTVTNNSRITINTAGRYTFLAVVTFQANASGNRALAFTVDGTTNYLVELFPSGQGTNSCVMSGTRTIVLAAAQYVECQIWQNSGSTLNVTLDEFAAWRITR
jgi:spore coat protein U-like protein